MFIKIKGAFDPSSVNGDHTFTILISLQHIVAISEKKNESAWCISLLGNTKFYTSTDEIIKNIPPPYIILTNNPSAQTKIKEQLGVQ